MSAPVDERAASRPAQEETIRAGLGIAVLRVALVPLVAIGQANVERPGPPDSDLFGPLLALVGVWAIVLLLVHVLEAAGRLPWLPRLARLEPVVDLVAIAALTYTSGGPYSEARLAFFALPLVAAFRLRPALTAAWAAAAVLAYVLISLSHPDTRSSADIDTIAAHALYLAWADVALLDLRMPTLDGLEILRRLRRDGIRVPVVLLSAFVQPEIVDQALTAGAAGYLSKDAPREEILAALEAAALRGRVIPDATQAQPPLIPAERALLQLLRDGWTAGELPALTGLDAGTITRHLLDAGVKLGTRRIDDTLTRALAPSCWTEAAMLFLFIGYGTKLKLLGAARGTDLSALPQHRLLAPA